MAQNQNQSYQQTMPARDLNDPAEKERILMKYSGIFKNNIREFAEKIIKRQKKVKNYSR